MNPRPTRLAAALLATATLAGGCVSQPAESPLEVTVVNLRFTHATVFETTALVQVRYENQTPEDLRVTGSAHRLSVNGLKMGKALSSESVTVPRLGTTTQELEVHLRNLSLARTIHDLSQSRTASYDLDGTVYVQRPGGSDRGVRVSRSGTLDLSQFAPPANAVP